MFQIKFNQLDNFLKYTKGIQDKLKNIDDVIPVIQNDLASKGNNVKIELAAGLQSQPPIPYARKNQAEILKLIESDSVIPVKLPQQPKFNTFKVNSNKKVNNKKIIKKEINESIIKWLIKNKDDIQ